MADTYRILVTGSRTWDDRLRVYLELGEIGQREGWDRVVVVHGACPRGADKLADTFAREHDMGIERHPANWERDSLRAGFARNEHMVSLGADICLAFVMPCTDPKCRRSGPHGSHGVSHCADLAEKAGIPVHRFMPEATP